jgi:hypothetical protein
LFEFRKGSIQVKNRHVIWLFAFVIVMTPLATGQAGSTAGPCYVAPGGDDVNTCSSVGTACATINGALAETSCSGTVFVAIGTYLGTGSEAVVSITRSIALSGGWDAGFTTQSGTSTIDGEDARRGLVIGSGVTAFVERFTISRGEGDGAAGISNEGNLTWFECTISNNMDIGDATSEGGGIRNGTNGTLALFNSTVSDNQSSSGAGLFNAWGTVAITNSTISGNSARGTGGGINNLGGTVYVNNATITNNSDNVLSNDPVAGGIHNEAGGTVELKNSIVAQNNNGGPDCNGTISSSGFNLIGDTSQCTFLSTIGDRVDIDPRLSALEDNGGPTSTHALQFSSPAINRGNPQGCQNHQGSLLNNDQRGYLRVQRCDIGAFEFQTFLHENYLPAVMKH